MNMQMPMQQKEKETRARARGDVGTQTELLGWDGGSRRLLGRVRACCPSGRACLGDAESERRGRESERASERATRRRNSLAETEHCKHRRAEYRTEQRGTMTESKQRRGGFVPRHRASYFAWSATGCLVQSSKTLLSVHTDTRAHASSADEAAHASMRTAPC